MREEFSKCEWCEEGIATPGVLICDSCAHSVIFDPAEAEKRNCVVILKKNGEANVMGWTSSKDERESKGNAND